MVVVSKKVAATAKLPQGRSKKLTADEQKDTKPKDIKVKAEAKKKAKATTKSTSKTTKTAVAKTVELKVVKPKTKDHPDEDTKTAAPKKTSKKIKEQGIDKTEKVSEGPDAENSKKYQIEDLFNKFEEFKKTNDQKACAVDKKINLFDSSIKEILSKLTDIDKRLVKQEFGIFGCCFAK